MKPGRQQGKLWLHEANDDNFCAVKTPSGSEGMQENVLNVYTRQKVNTCNTQWAASPQWGGGDIPRSEERDDEVASRRRRGTRGLRSVKRCWTSATMETTCTQKQWDIVFPVETGKSPPDCPCSVLGRMQIKMHVQLKRKLGRTVFEEEFGDSVKFKTRWPFGLDTVFLGICPIETLF